MNPSPQDVASMVTHLDKVISPAINSFASTEQIYVLTGEQLKEIIEAATRPLLDRIDTIQKEHDEIQRQLDLQAENQYIHLQIIKKMREKPVGKTESNRVEKILRYMEARPDHKASFETLRGYLNVDKARLNETIKTLLKQHPGRFNIVHAPDDKRKRVLIMCPK